MSEENKFIIEAPKFDKEMKKTYTMLIPSMLDFHFEILEGALNSLGYKTKTLTNKDTSLVKEGLKYVHNDTCYPALCVIGQFINALQNEKDIHHVALIITQTGGGCRATNYVPLLRKALVKAGYGFVPIICLNLGNLFDSSGIKINIKFLKRLIAAVTYGDAIMYLYNKVRSYEINPGSSLMLADKWTKELKHKVSLGKGVSFRDLKNNLQQIVEDFNSFPVQVAKKPKVGIVGEIYVKYSPIGNNHLEEFLVQEGAEIMVPGLYGFILYCMQNAVYDYSYYGGSKLKLLLFRYLLSFLSKREHLMIDAISKSKFTPMKPFSETKEYSKGVIKHGAKMGEGWLLTAEMMELVSIGFDNIVCAQPFGCLPNHICGKGVMKRIAFLHPKANIVPIDYDSSASKVNQENRIKLMMAVAKEKLEE